MSYNDLLADFIDHCHRTLTADDLIRERTRKTVNEVRGERFIVQVGIKRVGGMKSSEHINHLLQRQAQATSFYERTAA